MAQEPIEKYIDINPLSVSNVIAIPPVADLNDYRRGGIYKCPTNTNISHRPSLVTYAFFLIVMEHSTDYCIQKLYIDNTVYSRRYYAKASSPWSNWYKFEGTDTGS